MPADRVIKYLIPYQKSPSFQAELAYGLTRLRQLAKPTNTYSPKKHPYEKDDNVTLYCYVWPPFVL